jgi:Ran GTPase-activating protein (RanGAP) involved in mRNA processing and transport
MSACGLRHLELSLTQIGSRGAAALAQGMLACAGSLEDVGLRSNRIESAGATSLAMVIGACTQLHSLRLQNNGIGDDGAEALGNGLATPTVALKVIALGQNDFSEEARARLKAAASDGLSVLF